jgi:hypothetical protein
MDPAILVAIISVSGTIIISILNVLVPLITEKRKAKREEQKEEFELVHKSSTELLSQLSHFKHHVIADIESSANSPVQQVYSDLRMKFYAWEQAIWPFIKPEQRKVVVDIRQEIEDVHTPVDLRDNYFEVSDEILRISKLATEKVR